MAFIFDDIHGGFRSRRVLGTQAVSKSAGTCEQGLLPDGGAVRERIGARRRHCGLRRAAV